MVRVLATNPANLSLCSRTHIWVERTDHSVVCRGMLRPQAYLIKLIFFFFFKEKMVVLRWSLRVEYLPGMSEAWAWSTAHNSVTGCISNT